MAKVYNVNIAQTNGGCTHMYYFKETLKSAGWVVSQSSDGTTLYPSSDGITTDSSGSGGMDNSYAWYFIKDPAGRRGIIAQCGTGSLKHENWRILVYENVSSSAGIFSGSTATTVPGVSNATSTGQIGMLGSGSTASPSMSRLFEGTTSYRSHTVAMDTPINGVYPYYSFTSRTPTAIGLVRNIIYADPVITGSIQDESPVVHRWQRMSGSANYGIYGFEYDYQSSVAQGGFNSDSTSAGVSVGLARHIHMYNTGYQVVGVPSHVLNVMIVVGNGAVASNFFATAGLSSFGSSAANSFSSTYDSLWPLLYGNTSTTTGLGYGYKGFSYYVKMNHVWAGNGAARRYPDTINLTTDAYVQAGCYCLPWPENVVPIA